MNRFVSFWSRRARVALVACGVDGVDARTARCAATPLGRRRASSRRGARATLHRVRRPRAPAAFDVGSARQGAAGELPLGAAARGSEEGRPADDAEQRRRRCSPQRDERKSRLRRAPWRSSSRRSRGSRASSRTTPRNAPDRAAARCAASPRTTSSSRRGLPREDAGRDRARQRRRRRTRRPPGSSRRSPTRRDDDHASRARQKAIDSTTRLDRHVPEYCRSVPAARRGPLLPRVRVRAGERPDQRAPRLLDLITEEAELEVHPERVPRVRRALLQRGAGRPDASGTSPRRRTPRSSSTRRRTTRSTATPGTSSRYVFWNKGDFAKALNAFKKTIDFGDHVRAAPERGEARRQRAHGHHPGLRARGRPDAPRTTSSRTSRATSRARTTRRSR